MTRRDPSQRYSPRTSFFATLVAVGLVAGAVLSGYASIGPFLITMESWSPYYQPFQAVVQPHRSIKWMNPTPSPHTIRHDGCMERGPCAFDSGAVPPDGAYIIPGLPPGRYPYHCEIHPIMRGVLVVSEDGQQVKGS